MSHLFAATTCKVVNGVSQICAGNNLPQPAANQDHISSILEVVLNIVGALALLAIVVSGLRYITSAGDPQKAAKARNGIIYALIGLVIAISAQAIVVFVVSRAVTQ